MPSIPENPDLFNLQAQIQHKIDFIAKNIDKNEQEIILIGHSIGAKMALGVMDSGVANVTAGYMLFPTIGKDLLFGKLNPTISRKFCGKWPYYFVEISGNFI